MMEAAKIGRLEVIKLLRNNNVPWHTIVCDTFASSNNYVCLKYVHQNGCRFSKFILIYAARSGNLELFKYVRMNTRTNWTSEVCHTAAKHNHADILKFAIEHGCPYSMMTYHFALRHVSTECIEYLSSIDSSLSSRYQLDVSDQSDDGSDNLNRPNQPDLSDNESDNESDDGSDNLNRPNQPDQPNEESDDESD
jgi:hypothetical protein